LHPCLKLRPCRRLLACALLPGSLVIPLRCDPYVCACAPPAVCTALTASARLASSETIPALLQSVLDLLPHPRELVRKKAVLTLHCFFQRCPDAVAPHLNRFRQLLCDKVRGVPQE
jgi:hypothetical protein